MARRDDHIWGLDLIRFGAAMLVTVFHLTWVEGRGTTLAWYGWIGVQIFFVISGFVIARSAMDATPKRFAVSRFLRLYPAAWICAIIGLIVAGLVHSHKPDLAGRFVASVLLYPTGPFLSSAYWTLPIEITFYALVFVLLLRGMFDRLEVVAIWLCLASALYNVAFALQCAGRLGGPDLDFGYGWKNLTLLRHGIYFAAGIFVWLWSEQRLHRGGRIAFALAVAAAPLEITCRSAELAGLMPVHVVLSAVWPVPVLIWLASLAMIAVSARWERNLGRPPAAFLAFARLVGLATYPLYLLHEQFGEAARNVLLKLDLSYPVCIAGAILASTALAALIAQFAEPALRRVLRSWLSPDGWRLAKRGRFIVTRRAPRTG